MTNNTEHFETEKLELLKKMIENAEKNIKAARQLLSQLVPNTQATTKQRRPIETHDLEGAKIIEGTFDGESMIGTDGKQYPVPANYASKSKLVEGDTLKLSILPDGTFLFKQIGPVERMKIMGTLIQDNTGNYAVVANGQSYKVLTASVTYYKGQPGDQATIIIPKNEQGEWGAVENLIRDIANVESPEKTLNDETSPGASVTNADQTDIDEQLKAGKDLI